MTQQLPTPTDITDLLRHLASDHPYQNRAALAAGEPTEMIMLGYMRMFVGLMNDNCQEFCEQDQHVCRALAESIVRAIHDGAHGITYDTGKLGFAFIQSDDQIKQMIQLVNAHHTHISTVPDTLEELLGNL